jgi:CRP-like cAMP-binding protein
MLSLFNSPDRRSVLARRHPPRAQVAAEDSTLFVITKQKLRQMESLAPQLALAVNHYILRHTSQVRHRLERDVSKYVNSLFLSFHPWSHSL